MTPPAPQTKLPIWTVGPIDAAWVRRYTEASGDDNPLHRDPETASAAGFSGIVVPGLLLLGLCEPAIRAWQPAARVNRLVGRFLQPLAAPVQVSVTGRIVLVTSGTQEVVVRLFVGTPEQPMACIAEASLSWPEA